MPTSHVQNVDHIYTWMWDRLFWNTMGLNGTSIWFLLLRPTDYCEQHYKNVFISLTLFITWPILASVVRHLQQWPRFWFSPLCSPGLNEFQSQCSPYLRLFICSFSFFCFCASETWSSFFQNHLSVLLQEFKVNSGILHRDIPGLAARPRRIKIPFEAGL